MPRRNPYEITSRYELGIDHRGDKEIFPAETDRGRVTTGSSELTLKIDPKNVGVMLRRKLDYAFPNQRAEVFVADVRARWHRRHARLATGRHLVFGRLEPLRPFQSPAQKPGRTQHEIVHFEPAVSRRQNSSCPRDLTAGRSAIRSARSSSSRSKSRSFRSNPTGQNSAGAKSATRPYSFVPPGPARTPSVSREDFDRTALVPIAAIDCPESSFAWPLE